MSNSIVGVRYIGKKERQEDTVCKTGAVWMQGQVHNFAADLAKALLAHTDSFAEAPLSMDGGTFLSGVTGKRRPQTQDVAAFVNLTAMGVEQMVLFARRELNRVISADGKDEEQIRSEVHALMANHNLDMEAERRTAESADGRRMFPFMATPEEYEALQSGSVRLALVPGEVVAFQPKVVEVMAGDVAPSDEPEAAETLDTLLARLEKPELIAFAKQEGVGISNTMSAEKLREKIKATLTERAGDQQAAA